MLNRDPSISATEETLIVGRTPHKYKKGSVNDGHRINLRFYFRQKGIYILDISIYYQDLGADQSRQD